MKVFSYPNMLLGAQSSSLLYPVSQGTILELAQFQEAKRSTQYFPSCNLKAEATEGTMRQSVVVIAERHVPLEQFNQGCLGFLSFGKAR